MKFWVLIVDMGSYWMDWNYIDLGFRRILIDGLGYLEPMGKDGGLRGVQVWS
jgi:hypothetical protein